MILSSFPYKALVPKQPFLSPHVLNSSTNSRKSLIKIPSVEIMFNDFDCLTTSVCWMFSMDGLLSFLYILFHFPLVCYILKMPFGDTLFTVVRIFTFKSVITKIQHLSGTKWCNITLICCSVSTLHHYGLIWKNWWKALN